MAAPFRDRELTLCQWKAPLCEGIIQTQQQDSSRAAFSMIIYLEGLTTRTPFLEREPQINFRLADHSSRTSTLASRTLVSGLRSPAFLVVEILVSIRFGHASRTVLPRSRPFRRDGPRCICR
jgi:hypothetical protein